MFALFKTLTHQTRADMQQNRTKMKRDSIKVATADITKPIRLSPTVSEDMYRKIRVEMDELSLTENETVRFILANYFQNKNNNFAM